MSNVVEPSELHRRIAEKKLLFGTCCDSGSPVGAELAGLCGFDVTWLDLEHGTGSWASALSFCQASILSGAIPMVRVPDATRASILHALDLGANIVLIPMVESVETAKQIAQFGKYQPVGNKGFAGSTRAMRFGTGDAKQTVARLNRETHLFVQIETRTGVERCAEILNVDGISGGLVGPADLSFSMGDPLGFDDAKFVETFVSTIRTIRATGKIAATATGRDNLITAGVSAGLQILVPTTEMLAIRLQWQQTVRDLTAKFRAK
jgi:4-hydroxy-2-oxoheptanedioate aldolase